MNIIELAQDNYILWGANWSLYTAKVRPYLIKKGINYIELNPSHPHFSQRVLPEIGHFTVPVIETPAGEIIADSTEIIEYFETRYPEYSMTPKDKTVEALAWLIHSYGSEGLHKPAMHYRWNTTEENRQFIIDEFSRSLEVKSRRNGVEETAGKRFSDAIRAKYLPALGIEGAADDYIQAVQGSTEQLYDTLNAHFLDYPYLLGGRPSVADFGMMGPLYAHLGRDISSNNDIKRKAPALYRWIETMNRSSIIDPELWYVPSEYFAADQLPETLMALLRLLCADYGPELIATAVVYHDWLNAEANRPVGSVVSFDGNKANHQILGEIRHVQRGVVIQRVALLDALIQHQRLTNLIDRMGETERRALEDILHAVGGEQIFALKLQRPMERDDYATVLA